MITVEGSRTRVGTAGSVLVASSFDIASTSHMLQQNAIEMTPTSSILSKVLIIAVLLRG